MTYKTDLLENTSITERGNKLDNLLTAFATRSKRLVGERLDNKVKRDIRWLQRHYGLLDNEVEYATKILWQIVKEND